MAKKKQEEKPRVMTRRAMSSHKKAQRRQRFIMFGGIGVLAAVVIIVIIGLVVGEIMPMKATVLEVNDAEFDLSFYQDTLEFYSQLYYQSIAAGSQSVSNISTGILELIEENELIYQAAAALGYTVTDDEIDEKIEELELEKSDVTCHIIRAELLREVLQDDYIGAQVPLSAPQVELQALMLESEEKAAEVRDLVLSTDNFTALAQEYGTNYYSYTSPYGDFGWHPASVLENYISNDSVLDYAFSMSAGEVSPPVSDNETSKKKGYWLLKVNTLTPSTDNGTDVTPATANVTALLLGNEGEALEVRDRLVAGEDVAALAAEYSQYSTSENNGGELGVLTQSETEGSYAVSGSVDAYIFNEDVELSAWSQPVEDGAFYTTGGAWIFKAVDTAEDRALSDDDRQSLIEIAYSEWFSDVQEDEEAYPINELLTDGQQLKAITEVTVRWNKWYEDLVSGS